MPLSSDPSSFLSASNVIASTDTASPPVSLWLTNVAAYDHAAINLCRSVMSTEELRRNGRYKLERDQKRDAVSRAFLRTTLSRFVSKSPQDWQFATHAHGKPYALDESWLFFNLSHSGDYVVLAVSSVGDIGVDIEYMSRSNDIEKIANHYFQAKEIDNILSSDVKGRRKNFYSLWTLKESYMKARGEGVSLGLNKIAFSLHSSENRISMSVDPELNDDQRFWQFLSWQLGEEYMLGLSLRCQQWLPVPLVTVVSSGVCENVKTLSAPKGRLAL